MSEPLIVILGGTRSGKSRLGRDRAAAVAGIGGVVYIGTALPGDPELDERIGLHRRDRPGDWATIEPGKELVAAVEGISDEATILLDGLTLWISLLVTTPPVDVFAIVDGPVAELLKAIATHRGPAIVVSDEVGLGLVPMDPVGRAFRDIMGIAHQRLVTDADEAWLTVAGRAIPLHPVGSS
jgi:adenosylcobinamide kinase/adenosylcobinamide-phosphate guanylyltransferase